MSIPPCGTFEYAGIIPDNWPHSSGPWRLQDDSGAPSTFRGDSLFDDRLLGLQPSLEIADAGLTPDVRVSPYTGIPRPKVLLSRLTLRADGKDRATVAAFSFCVDQALTRSFRPGDIVHLARTACGGLGLSVIRGERLVAAAGAVTAVPCGESVQVGLPAEVIEEAERVFRKLDPEFEFLELPIEVRVGSERRVLHRGRPRLAAYDVFIEHGVYRGIPGTDECAAISLQSACPATAAVCSAPLLEYGDLSEVLQW
jgi:hypothetical protein